MSASDPLERQIDAFAQYLADERRSSPRTVETYVRDLRSFRDFVREQGLPLDARELDIVALTGVFGQLVPHESGQHDEEEGERDSFLLQVSPQAPSHRPEPGVGVAFAENRQVAASISHGRPSVSRDGCAAQRREARQAAHGARPGHARDALRHGGARRRACGDERGPLRFQRIVGSGAGQGRQGAHRSARKIVGRSASSSICRRGAACW